MFHPYLQGGRKKTRIVQGCRGDIDGRRPLGTFVEELAAAGATELSDNALGGAVGARVTREYFDLPSVEGQPSHGRGGIRPAARGAMADAGIDRLSGNAKPNCRTEAAAFMDLHGSGPAVRRWKSCYLASDLIKTAPRRTPDGERILRSAWPKH